MSRAAIVRSSVLVRLYLAAGLMATATTVSAAQAPGQVYTGANGGIGLNSGSSGYDTKKAPPAVRVVQGAVLDPAGAPVKGAMVYLKDDKTSQVRSMLADQTGKFRFINLSFNDDYKLWAQARNRKSPERPISSMDTKSELNRDLKIE